MPTLNPWKTIAGESNSVMELRKEQHMESDYKSLLDEFVADYVAAATEAANKAADQVILDYADDEVFSKRDLWRAAKAGFSRGVSDNLMQKHTEELSRRMNAVIDEYL